MAELGGITYTELAGSPVEHASRDGVQVTRELKCNWNERLILARYLLGGIFNGQLITPDIYIPEGSIKLKNVYCNDVTIKPLGRYEDAQITAEYSTLNYSIQEAQQEGTTTYIIERIEPAVEFITLPNVNLYWGDGTAVDETEVPSYLNRMLDWCYELHGLTYIPAPAIDLIGYINNANVYSKSLDYTFAAGTLLCGNPILSREWNTDGITLWTIGLRFTYKPNGWNYFPRISDSGASMTWEVVYDDASQTNAKLIYPAGDFSSLII